MIRNNFTFRAIKSYFHFQKQDRNAIILLVGIIVIVLLGHMLVDQVRIRSNHDFSAIEKVLEEWESATDTLVQRYMFPFDPNKITKEELKVLDIPLFIQENIIRYRNAGGKFHRPFDLRKIYGMNDSIYSAIESYLFIPQADRFREGGGRDTTKKIKQKGQHPVLGGAGTGGQDRYVELNQADSLQLTGLRGIGPVFAVRIMKYRHLLGGFYSCRQLLEVYGFPEDTYFSLREQIQVDTTRVRKIRLNFADFAELIRHPYLEEASVRKILRHRSENGAFTSTHQLLEYGLLDSADFRRAAPYFTCR
ncbi:MAG: helix-hairpin-helix domain-containing protein [Mariniphaga sp.]|nr:helix-hairpin-helix domain-containing protein [Mariniphaga sp.]MDD4426227.1 helix-hairpin-helix domain-containing protein [Mariniphaga sp.]